MRNLIFTFSIIAAIMVSNNLMGGNNDPAKDKEPAKIERKIIKTLQTSEDGKTMIDSTTTIENGETIVRVDTIVISTGFPLRYGGMGQMHTKRIGNKNIDEFEMDYWQGGDSIPKKDFYETKKGFRLSDQNLLRYEKNKNFEMDESHQPPMPDMRQPKGQKNMQSKGIDLNDPSIISYEKKEQKDGTEKITIIRKIQQPCCTGQRPRICAEPEIPQEQEE
jgi:hypothetical protein